MSGCHLVPRDVYIAAAATTDENDHLWAGLHYDARRDNDQYAWLDLWQLVEKQIMPGVWRRYHLPGYDKDDLATLAKIALVEAVEKWEPHRAPFKYYTRLKIYGRVSAEMRSLRRPQRSAHLNSTSFEELFETGEVPGLVAPTVEDELFGEDPSLDSRLVDQVLGGMQKRSVSYRLVNLLLAEPELDYLDYNQLAQRLGVKWVAIHSAYRRIRRKAVAC